MFHLAGGLILTIYPRSELAKDASVAFAPSKSGEFSIGHAVASHEGVDALIAHAQNCQAGNVVETTRPPMGHLLGVLPGSRRTPVGDHAHPRNGNQVHPDTEIQPRTARSWGVVGR